MKRFISLNLFTSIVFTLLLQSANGQSSVPIDDNKKLRVTISSDSKFLRKDNPFDVQFKVENGGNSEIDLLRLPVLQIIQNNEIRSRYSESYDYYAFIGLSGGAGEKSKTTLQPGGIVEYTVDISRLKWARSGSSFSPSECIFNLATQGDLSLTLVIEIDVQHGKQSTREKFVSNLLKFDFVERVEPN